MKKLRFVPMFLSSFLALFLTNCETLSFYTQAARGQAEITFKRRAVSKVIEDESTDKAVVAQLKLAQSLVNFAETELSLKSSGSYRHYTDLDREHVVFIVHASPEFSLEPKTWWYPVVGTQDYRGYFKEEDAHRTRDALQKEGFDCYVGGVNAYSTLGFFKDPLLNTFIDYPEVDLAELIFHELTHHRYYEKNETPFNEALAEVVAREGTRRWLRKNANAAALAKYELRLKRRSAIRSAIEQTIKRLEQLYQKELADKEMRARKEAEISVLKEEITQLYKGWKQKPNHFLSTPLNNARLNAFTTYEALVPEIEKQLARHNGDVDSLIKEVKKKGPLILEN